ncbi:MAG: class I SAM-dependent methyltransferase [Anaerolineae bacterium]|jgi:ubiquinone/menaquinone biosynthesis C-methylase UbiE|nr:class I SAM-dependent methyltransferase [Anaerolineae bacterium]
MTQNSVIFNQAADFYDQTRGFPPGQDHAIATFLAQSAGLTRESRVLEIGIGTGRIALPLAALTGPLYGVDLSRSMMDRIADKAADYPDSRLHLAQADVMDLPFATGRFDAVIVVHVLHLVADAQRTVKELARVLRPGGVVLHAWNERNEAVFKPLMDAWHNAIPPQEAHRDRWHVVKPIFQDLGWDEMGDEQIYSFIQEQSPQEMVRRYRERVWSSLWTMPDEVWARGVAAVEHALKLYYPTPQQALHVPSSFHVRVYRRPL